MRPRPTVAVAPGDHEHLFAAFCQAAGLSPDELASTLVAEALDRLAQDPDVARNLRALRREQTGLRVVGQDEPAPSRSPSRPLIDTHPLPRDGDRSA